MHRENVKFNFNANGLENSIIVSIILFLFNLIFPQHDSFILMFINEVLVFLTIALLYSYLQGVLSTKTDAPISLVLNTGILAALIFFVVSISNSLFGSQNLNAIELSFFNSLFSVLVVFVFIAVLVYIFTTFRILFFLRQKKNPSTYFNTMIFFFVLSFFSNILVYLDKTLDYPKDAFFVVSIMLISLNSIRVAWIAFLPKKQKYYLLVISIILSILFGLNFSLMTSANFSKQMLYIFSPGLQTLFSMVMIYGTIYFVVIFFTTLFHLPTAEAFDHKAEEVTSLMDVTKLITQVFDFKELADTITGITVRVCNADSAWLVTRNEDKIELNSVRNIGYIDADLLSQNILNENQQDILSVEIIHKENIYKSDVLKKYKSVAIAPLKVHDEISGFLFAARLNDNEFDSDEKKSIQAFADYAAVALENAKLLAQSIEKERLEKELDVARDIQRKILPREVPNTQQLQISSLFVPAFEVGGDYYDFFEIDKCRLGFVIADVSGKGISAAFIMAEVKGIFESLSQIIHNPKELLIKANNVLKASLDKKSFVTAIYGIIDKSNGKVVFSRAGHTPLMLSRHDNYEKFQPSGIGLGLDQSINFSETLNEMEIQLNNDDILICYSDGIPEAMDLNHEEFGYDRLGTIVQVNRYKTLDEISNQIMKELSVFSKDHSQHDDITLVLIRWNKNKNGEC